MGVKCQPYVAHSVLQQPGFSGATREAVGDRIRAPAIRFTPCGLLAVRLEKGMSHEANTCSYGWYRRAAGDQRCERRLSLCLYEWKCPGHLQQHAGR
jgi:hypothetical protein